MFKVWEVLVYNTDFQPFNLSDTSEGHNKIYINNSCSVGQWLSTQMSEERWGLKTQVAGKAP